MVDTGKINPKGILYAGLSLAARLLKPHVVLMESINSLLKRVCQESPNISLELLSARVLLKKHVGFTADEHASADDRVDSASVVTTSSSSVGQGHQPRRIQPRVTQAKSFKQIRPFALMLSERLLPLLRDTDRWVQRMDRWVCPQRYATLRLPAT